ncbi:heme/copper-type cytochrome/quinol oxidase subunit 2 [Variovorax boronicumulans]|uniref:hypothetical protein n=1 Tax=Variovorax boronicumulans TaxID=436515 RepID=UPI002780B073|nr:hypothetical protein [Variovorax boronicumulans]MDP9991983.1 heme/copper-type cytochrome/quinol oxidase subunit 2 [Variovorax boronicumulans]MDQ0001878.1 heme/copper-type cytochrome/quinol oxidase subunit 2 [Variovorax boronicumulans]
MNEQTAVTIFLIALVVIHLVVGVVLVRATRREQRRRDAELEATWAADAALKPYPPMRDEYF